MENKFWCAPSKSSVGETALTVETLNQMYEDALELGPEPDIIDLRGLSPEEVENQVRILLEQRH